MEGETLVRAEMSALQKLNTDLEAETMQTKTSLCNKAEEVTALQDRINFLNQQMTDLNAQLEAKDEELKTLDELAMQLDTEKDLRARAEAREENERRERLAVSTQLSNLQSSQPGLSTFEEENKQLKLQLQTLLDNQSEDAVDAQTKLKELAENLLKAEDVNRKLRSAVADLKGAIRVYARVRPFLATDFIDGTKPDTCITSSFDDTVVHVISSPSDTKSFTVDKVFRPTATQEDVFFEVANFVQSGLDGYDVCLLSYGQTGSGKTHTMCGVGDDSMRGIIPRTMELIGRYKTDLESRGWSYKMRVSCIDIFNDTIRDLLRLNDKDDKKIDIRRDMNGVTYFSNAVITPVDPSNKDQVKAILDKAESRRNVNETAGSHYIFTLYIDATNSQHGVSLNGSISMVDLAGSERIEQTTGSAGDRAKSITVNKNMSALAGVLSALANKASHVPFRDAKLTHFLQPSLSGEGKALLIVNLTPTVDSTIESLASLRLASQASICELGKPVRHISEISN